MARAYRTTARDFTGMVFGRLTAIEPTAIRSGNNVVWKCRCTCGNESLVHSGNLVKGNTKSCGCLKRENRTHGETTKHTMTVEYSTWASMHRRCYNPKNKRFPRYGGRGITVCDAWHEFGPFLADMGRRPTAKHTLERIDNDGHYCPENCVWATKKVQNRNTSQNRYLTLKGTTLCMQDWCIRTGLTRNTINHRLRSGWTDERILTTPVDSRRQHFKRG